MLVPTVVSLLLSTLAPLLEAADEETLEPNPRPKAYAKLRPFEFTYTLFRVEGERRQEMQDIRMVLDRTVRDGQKLLRIAAHTKVGSREIADQSWLDPQTLAPRYRSVPQPNGGTEETEISETSVVGQLVDANGEVVDEFDAEYDAPFFDMLATPIWLSTLKLEVGKTLRYPTVKLQHGGEPSWQTAKVESRESIAWNGETKKAYRLDVSNVEMGASSKVWLTQKPPYVLRKEVNLPGGTKIVWEPSKKR